MLKIPHVIFAAFAIFSINGGGSSTPILTPRSLAGSSPAVLNDKLTWQGAAAQVVSSAALTSCAITAGNGAGNFATAANGSGCDISITSTGVTNLTGASDQVSFSLTVTGTNSNGTSAGVVVAVDVYADGSTQNVASACTNIPHPTKLNGYVTRPPWKVAGVDYYVGPAANATVSGNTITETGAAVAPTNGDKKTFYNFCNNSLPSGIVQGTQYFVCGVAGSSGTFTYTLSSASNCVGTISLGASTAFIALKDPASTTNLPTGVGSIAANSINVTAGASPTIDHYDMSLLGSYQVQLSTTAHSTITNNYYSSGSSAQRFVYGNGSNTTDVTIKNNYITTDSVYRTNVTSASRLSGNTTLTLSATTGFSNGMFCGDADNLSAFPLHTTATFSGTTMTLSSALTGNVGSGDHIDCWWAPVGMNSPVSFNTSGAAIIEYNYFPNLADIGPQPGPDMSGGGASTITMNFNTMYNIGWAGQFGDHGDFVQTTAPTGQPGNSQVYKFGSYIVDDSRVQAQGLSLLAASGNSGASYTTVHDDYNAYILTATPAQIGYGGGQLAETWVTTTATISNNYGDFTGAKFGWYCVIGSCIGTVGPNATVATVSGNINMVTGSACSVSPGSGGTC